MDKPARVGKEQFGKYLKVHVPALREKVRPDALQRWLREHHVRTRVLNELEDGCWHSVKQHTLFALMHYAHGEKVRPFLEILDSGLWNTFRQSDSAQLLAAPNENGGDFTVDHEVIHVLGELGIRMSFSLIPPTTSRESIVRKMGSTDLLIIGSAKRNLAADAALCALWPDAPPTFIYPELADVEAVTAIQDKNSPPTLMLNGWALSEDKTRRVGIVAICRNPTGEKDVTTIIVAGCSRLSTKEVLEQLWQPEMYRHLPDMQKPENAGKPWLLVYDNKKKRGHWQLHGVERHRRKRGRPEKKPR